MYETIFPTGWGLTRPDPNNPAVEQALGLPLEKLEERARNCVTCFLETLFDPEKRACATTTARIRSIIPSWTAETF